MSTKNNNSAGNKVHLNPVRLQKIAINGSVVCKLLWVLVGTRWLHCTFVENAIGCFLTPDDFMAMYVAIISLFFKDRMNPRCDFGEDTIAFLLDCVNLATSNFPQKMQLLSKIKPRYQSILFTDKRVFANIIRVPVKKQNMFSSSETFSEFREKYEASLLHTSSTSENSIFAIALAIISNMEDIITTFKGTLIIINGYHPGTTAETPMRYNIRQIAEGKYKATSEDIELCELIIQIHESRSHNGEPSRETKFASMLEAVFNDTNDTTVAPNIKNNKIKASFVADSTATSIDSAREEAIRKHNEAMQKRKEAEKQKKQEEIRKQKEIEKKNKNKNKK